MFWIYNILVTLVSPFWLPWAWFRSRRRREKVRRAERMGRVPLAPGPDRIWLHAVSVGEVHAAVPVLKKLREKMPGFEIVLSTTTSSGQQAARDGADGLFDHLIYFPMDVARWTLNAMLAVRPKAVVMMETELWLNFLWAADVVGAKCFLINGRLSDRSFPRAMRLRSFYRAMLRYVHRCLMQSAIDAERIIALGADPLRVVNVGNTKFDQAIGPTLSPGEARQEFGISAGVPCVVVGSTRSTEEEELVLSALRQVREKLPDLTFILAPRHIERADEVEATIRSFGFTPRRRSSDASGPKKCDATGLLTESQAAAEDPHPNPPPQAGEGILEASLHSRTVKGSDCLLLDTFGELGRAYGAGDVAIVGGGFGGFGGQNIFQPLALGLPTIYGPAMSNFRDIAEMAEREGVGFRLDTAESVAEELLELLQNPDLRREIGENAQHMIAVNVGASERIGKIIAVELDPTLQEAKDSAEVGK